MPLSFVKAGETRIIHKLNGKDGLCRYLHELGFVEGEKVTVISDVGGSMILQIKNSRIAVGKNIVHRIMV